MLFKIVLILIGFFQFCDSVIYQLNETEYALMPPLYDLDEYESCLQQSDGVFCWAEIQLCSEDHQNELLNLIREYSKHTPKHYDHSKIERGICVRKTCSQYIRSRDLERKEDIKQILAECINRTLIKDYGLQGNISKFSCDKHNEISNKDIYDWLFLTLILSIFALNIAGTLCDTIIQRHDNSNQDKSNGSFIKYLQCFSLIQNWNWLVSSESNDDPRLQRLKGLHAVRTVTFCSFIIGHSLYAFHCFTKNPHQYEEFYEYACFKIIFNGYAAVHILFTVSGFLQFYHLLLQSEKQPVTWKAIPQIVFLRFWRLTPVNIVYVLFTATWLRHWGSGPIWKKIITNMMSGGCRTYWWSHLFYINNYIPDDKYCVITNWQLSADFQLFVLGLCIFVATRHKGRKSTLIALLLAGMTAMGLHIWWQDLDIFLLVTPEAFVTADDINLVVHKFTHVNIPSTMIGMLAAQIVYEWQKRNVDFSTKKLLKIITHLVLPATFFFFYCCSVFYADAERPSLSLRIMYGIFHRPVVATVNAFVLISMAMNFDDLWIRLDWHGWVILSRLTYSVSVIHVFFIIVSLGSRTQLIHVSGLAYAKVTLGIVGMSFLAAVPYCLLVEAPMNKLLKVILRKNIKQRNKIE